MPGKQRDPMKSPGDDLAVLVGVIVTAILCARLGPAIRARLGELRADPSKAAGDWREAARRSASALAERYRALAREGAFLPPGAAAPSPAPGPAPAPPDPMGT